MCMDTLVLYILPQISFSNSIGIENIPISIVWVIASSGRQHLIDLRNPVKCECIFLPVIIYFMNVFVSYSGSVQLLLVSSGLFLMSGG